MPKPVITFVFKVLCATLHMPKPVITLVFKVLRNALLRYVLSTFWNSGVKLSLIFLQGIAMQVWESKWPSHALLPPVAVAKRTRVVQGSHGHHRLSPEAFTEVATCPEK